MPTATKIKKASQKPLESVTDATQLAAIARRKRAARIASLTRSCEAWKRKFDKYLEIHYGGLEALAANGFKRHPPKPRAVRPSKPTSNLSENQSKELNTPPLPLPKTPNRVGRKRLYPIKSAT